MAFEIVPHMQRACVATFELSTADVETVIEIPADSIWSFLGNVAGNLGMLFGTSLYGVFFTNINSLSRYDL